MIKALQSTSKQNRLQTASTNIRADNEYKPGGKLSFVQDDLVSKFHSMGADRCGRWTYMRFNCRGFRNITIVAVHQPCQGKPKTDSMTMITQQYSLYLQEKRNKPEKVVRHHFVQDLQHFLYTLKAQRDRIILAGDLNEVLGATGNGIDKLCQQFHLVDAMRYQHGPTPQGFATWVDGSKVLDYTLVDTGLLNSLSKCGYEPFDSRIHSDHRGMFIDFDASMLFGAENTQLANMARCRMHSTNPQQVTLCIKHKLKYPRDHNFFKNLEHLQQHPEDALAERLDKTSLRSSLYAESRLPQCPDVPYSPTIANL